MLPRRIIPHQRPQGEGARPPAECRAFAERTHSERVVVEDWERRTVLPESMMLPLYVTLRPGRQRGARGLAYPRPVSNYFGAANSVNLIGAWSTKASERNQA